MRRNVSIIRAVAVFVVAAALGVGERAAIAQVGGYAPPPGTYGSTYYPPPPPSGVFRAFSLTIAGGPGFLSGPGERALAISYSLFRLNFGLAPNLSFYLGFDGAGASAVNPATNRDSWLWQHLWSMGVQAHVHRRLYFRGGVGVASVGEDTDVESFSGGTGIALAGGVGYELVQNRNVAVGIEAAISATRYAREWWEMGGLHLTLALF